MWSVRLDLESMIYTRSYLIGLCFCVNCRYCSFWPIVLGVCVAAIVTDVEKIKIPGSDDGQDWKTAESTNRQFGHWGLLNHFGLNSPDKYSIGEIELLLMYLRIFNNKINHLQGFGGKNSLWNRLIGTVEFFKKPSN